MIEMVAQPQIGFTHRHLFIRYLFANWRFKDMLDCSLIGLPHGLVTGFLLRDFLVDVHDVFQEELDTLAEQLVTDFELVELLVAASDIVVDD